MTITHTESASSVETPEVDDRRKQEVDAIVDSMAEAARAFRKLDQQQVDAIVEAMVRAGVRAAAELASVAIEETGFGVFEDKVVDHLVGLAQVTEKEIPKEQLQKAVEALDEM